MRSKKKVPPAPVVPTEEDLVRYRAQEARARRNVVTSAPVAWALFLMKKGFLVGASRLGHHSYGWYLDAEGFVRGTLGPLSEVKYTQEEWAHRFSFDGCNDAIYWKIHIEDGLPALETQYIHVSPDDTNKEPHVYRLQDSIAWAINDPTLMPGTPNGPAIFTEPADIEFEVAKSWDKNEAAPLGQKDTP